MFRQDGKQLPLESRGSIISLKNVGLSNVEIANSMGCSEFTVRKWLKRYEQTGSVSRKIGSSRPFKLTGEQRNALYFVARDNPFASPVQLKGNTLIRISYHRFRAIL